jgi:hypothetical protein
MLTTKLIPRTGSAQEPPMLIKTLLAQSLKYEATGKTFTAYAIMALDPKVIAEQLAKEKELYARLQKTKAFEALNQEANAFAAFKATQK